MKPDKFLLITVGALPVIILILLAFGGAAFLCLVATNGPVTNKGPVLQKSFDYNGTLSRYSTISLDVTNINGDAKVVEGDGDSYAISVNSLIINAVLTAFFYRQTAGLHAVKPQ